MLLLVGHESSGFDGLRWGFGFRDDGAIPASYRYIVFGMVLVNMAVSILWESVVVNVVIKNITLGKKKRDVEVNVSRLEDTRVLVSQSTVVDDE